MRQSYQGWPQPDLLAGRAHRARSGGLPIPREKNEVDLIDGVMKPKGKAGAFPFGLLFDGLR